MTFERVLDHICDERTPLSHPRLYMLSELRPDEMELFASRWATMSAMRRRHVTAALVEIAEVNVTVDFSGIFRLGLDDDDAEVRTHSIDGLWEDEGPALVDSLLRMLSSDPSIPVRAAAATSLGRFVLLSELEELDEELGNRIVKALWEVLEDPSEALGVRRRVVEAISFSGEERVRGIIEEAYHHQSEKMRVSAIFSMGRSADPTWGPSVISELTSPNPEMRFEAARACGELELREAVPGLIDLILDPDREVQQAAIFALGKIGGQEARRALQACCESDDEVIATAGDEALGELEFTSGIFEFPLYEEE
jgi:HEAT repeat protein